MALDLERLRTEMQAYLEESGVPVFYGRHGMLDTLNQVSWDVETHPDFREFISAGRKAGARLMVFNHRAFSLDQVDEALDQLDDADLTREEKRNFETRLRQLRAYEGFTCALELSFNIENQVFTFELYTDWYQALNETLAELEALSPEQEEDGEQDTLGGYFSKN